MTPNLQSSELSQSSEVGSAALSLIKNGKLRQKITGLIYGAQFVYVFACSLANDTIPFRKDLNEARLNAENLSLNEHLRISAADWKRYVGALVRVKRVYALISLPIICWQIAFSYFARFCLPAPMRRLSNYHYDRSMEKYSDPRLIRDLALDLRPLILGWMTLAPPTALLLLAGRNISSLRRAMYKNIPQHEGIEGFECLRLTQNPDSSTKREITFFHSPAFPLAAFLVYLLGLPGIISAFLYFPYVDALIGYPSRNPQFVEIFLVYQLYFLGLSWCMSTLFFRSYLTYALSYTSCEFDIEIYPDVIKALPIKGWFSDFALMRALHVPCQIAWQDVNKVRYHDHKLPEINRESLPKTLRPIASISQIFEALSTKLDLGSDCLELVGKGSSIFIQLGHLSKQQKANLFMCLHKYAPSVHLSSMVQECLMGTAVLNETRYTQIWFDALTAKPSAISADYLQAGQKLKEGEYTVVEKIGAGGQAVVYKATDRDGNPLVLKEFQLTPGESIGVMIDSARTFEIESTILSRLQHDKIVRMKDVLYQNNRVYLVLDYIEGTSLRRRVKERGSMDEELVLSLALQMCEILTYLHKQDPSIVHRDFTPDNLILKDDGQLVLVDFSVAQSGHNVKKGDCAGKHAYTPPEQFRGESCPQSDIYALGATLYFLVSGKDPSPITTSKPLKNGIIVSEDLAQIIECATELSLDKRFESAQWLELAFRSATKPDSQSLSKIEA